MSSSQTNDTPSPRTTQSSKASQDGNGVPPAQAKPQAESPRRPSFEKLDPAEVAKALEVAELLKRKPATAQKPKKEVRKQAPPPPREPEFIPRPPPVPFSDNSNPDAVALRATTDLLQMQKARAAHNIQLLEQLKEINRKDPLNFLKQLQAGNLKPAPSHQDGILGPTVAPEMENLLASLHMEAVKGQETEKGAGETHKMDGDGKTAGDNAEIPRFPTPQNIVRTPAINWAKYGIVGESLDKMHEEQKTNPSLGEPEQLATRDAQPTVPVAEQHQYMEPKADKFAVAAPYDPLKDGTDSKDFKKPS